MYYSDAIRRIDDKLMAVVFYNPDGTVQEIKWDDFAYKTLHGTDQVKPSLSEIEAVCDTIKAEREASLYKDKRIGEYASIGDQLDMKYHDLLDGTTTWKDHVEGIKNKHPKPQGGCNFKMSVNV